MTYFSNTGTHACTAPRSRFSLLSLLADRTALLRQRRALKALDAHTLEDIGVSRTDALREAKRPVWDAPESWRC